MNSSRDPLSSFKDILNNLLTKHAFFLDSGETKISIPYDFNVMSNSYLNILQIYVEKFQDSTKILCLLDSIEKNLKPENKNIYVKIKHNFYPVIILGDTVPLVFDLLLTIFYNSISTERQHFFHDLVDYYYIELNKKIKPEVSFERETFENHIKMFLPLVKLEYLHLLHGDLNKNEERESIIRELNEHILYPNLSRQDCYKIIKKYLSTSAYIFIDYQITALNNLVGYLGQYCKIIIKVEYNNKEKNLILFGKYLPNSCSTLMSMAIATFKKEQFIYSVFFEMLSNYGFSNILDFSAKYYFARSNDIIILEDLTYLNYKSSHPRKPVEHNHMVCIIKQLAKFHASSLILEEKRSKDSGLRFRIGEKFSDYLQEVSFSYLGNIGTINKQGVHIVVNYMIDKFPDICQKLTVDEFKKSAKKAFNMMYQNVKESNKYRNVICHGDLWMSNILTKYDENNKNISCRIVDYQIIRYCPPAVDLFFLIYNNTDKKMRNQYLPELIAIYYKQLSDILSMYDINIDTIYDGHTFSNCIQDMKSTGICQALCYLQVLLIPEEKLDVLFSNQEKTDYFLTTERIEYYEKEKIWENEIFSRRIKELIEDLYEICIC